MAYDGAMSRVAALLRALLCLALLLNGTAYAHAATRMAMGDMAAAVEAAGDATPPCHEGMDMAMPMDDVDASKAGHHDIDPGLPDCCKAGSCDGFCTQHAPAMTWLAAVGTPCTRQRKHRPTVPTPMPPCACRTVTDLPSWRPEAAQRRLAAWPEALARTGSIITTGTPATAVGRTDDAQDALNETR